MISQFEDGAHAAAGGLNPEAVLLERTDSERLHAAVNDLPYEYREVLILREWEGLSYKEIAEIAGIPLGTVMSRLSRSRKELERRLCGAREDAQFRQEATS
jgi:RNA polymerase sigma-70 factor (ECF subfamily)